MTEPLPDDLSYIFDVARDSTHPLVRTKLIELVTAVRLAHSDEVIARRQSGEEYEKLMGMDMGTLAALLGGDLEEFFDDDGQ